MRYFGLNTRLVWLALVGSGSGLLYGLALYLFPLQTYYAQPGQALAMLTTFRPATAFMLVAGILLLFIGYARGMAAVAAMRRHRRLPALIFGFPLLFSVLLLPVAPVSSNDLYDYLFRGWMLDRYQANTFVQTPAAFAADPLFRFVGWPQAVTAYGPLWEYMSGFTTHLATVGAIDSSSLLLLRFLFAYKQLSMLGFFLCGAAIWAALRQVAPEQQYVGLYMWLWNPLALWESVVAGHNDAWMMLAIVVALGALNQMYRVRQLVDPWKRRHARSRRRAVSATPTRMNIALMNTRIFAFAPIALFAYPTMRAEPVPLRLDTAAKRTQEHFLVALFAVLALAAGALIKYLPLFLMPVIIAAALRRLPTWAARWRFVVISGLGCGALIVIAYAPFWVGWATLRNFSDRAGVATVSWLSVLHMLLIKQGFTQITAQWAVAMIGLGLFMAGIAWATWRAWRQPRDVATIMAWLMLWFILVSNPAPRAWYVLWVLALAALQPHHTRLVRMTGVVCCLAMLSYVVAWMWSPI